MKVETIIIIGILFSQFQSKSQSINNSQEPLTIDSLHFLPKEYEAYDYKRRDKQEKPNEAIDCIGIKPGMKIGEAGAGRGYFTFHLS